MSKKYSYFKSELTDLFVISDELHKETFSGMDDEYNCMRIVRKLNTLTDENGQLRKENDMFSCELSVSANKEISRNCRIAELEEENKQLKQALREQLEENGNAYCIEILDKIFDLKYDEWQRKMNETHTYDYIDWEKVLNDKGDV